MFDIPIHQCICILCKIEDLGEAKKLVRKSLMIRMISLWIGNSRFNVGSHDANTLRARVGRLELEFVRDCSLTLAHHTDERRGLQGSSDSGEPYMESLEYLRYLIIR